MTDFILEPAGMYCCQNCGNELSPIVKIRGLTLLKIGEMVVTECKGICLNCGANAYFHFNEKKLRRLYEEEFGVWPVL